ncbi:hypothetical protein H7B90_03625 [Cohnella xylanilytica]|uniref:Uncharacterized protein n=1 Tax=Cohnella xylanilytica TaxID=557555 RepID=A0A841TQQ3_9BACL|nr:hypothetical protein [Cohnella xylanilytica]MBB6690485.1 hypothetical protein [Cohnella xylanilytica]
MEVQTPLAMERRPTRWRMAVFRILAAVFALGSFAALDGFIELLLPFTRSESYLPYELHWHGGVHGALIGLLLGGSLVMLLFRPAAGPAVLRFYILGHGVFLVALAITDWNLYVKKLFVTGMFAVVCLSLYAAYPYRDQVFRSSGETRTPSRPVAMLTAAAAAALLPLIWRGISNQWAGLDDEFRWGENSALYLNLIMAGFFAAGRSRDSVRLGILTGIVYLYLAAAALTIPHHAGSLGTWGGIASAAVGAGYILLSARRDQG